MVLVLKSRRKENKIQGENSHQSSQKKTNQQVKKPEKIVGNKYKNSHPGMSGLNFIQMAPNFGGIWEAAVKVAKGHLYRSLGNAKLSFEELSTALVEIEAIMNSRPITSISTDPNDFEALTPAHLLIGSSLKAIPELLTEVSDISYLERWRRINAVKTHFWKRWSNEYVTELQGRGKWTTSSPNIAIGSLVIIHEDNLPPQKWLLGRVTKVIEGPDGRVRVADVKTQRGTFRRPIRKLAAIPS
ncbi:uncharacterized protein LOC129939783 [Eupeodes corollae]|uniref:uncharacterized protein LOC129939783 n=1 Tax=Eupeodes corollae TaxID=290404 RepID=UPI0024913516|nr:uncharacterized protein LOC129939783 [Eupeodes corollae]